MPVSDWDSEGFAGAAAGASGAAPAFGGGAASAGLPTRQESTTPRRGVVLIRVLASIALYPPALVLDLHVEPALAGRRGRRRGCGRGDSLRARRGQGPRHLGHGACRR